MSCWELKPRLGIGPVTLGMSRDEVHALLTPGTRPSAGDGNLGSGREHFLHENCVEVEYVDGVVSFIGVYGGSNLDVVYRGVDIFRTLFRDVAVWLAEEAEVDVGDDDFPTTWTFPSLWLSLWREMTEGDIDADLRPADDSGQFVKQVAVDRRFASVRRSGSWDRAPRGAPAFIPRELSTAEVWRIIERREQAGDRWADIVRAFKVLPG